jgi:hypothetical protein
VVGDWILDDLEKLLLGVDRSNGKAVEELNHKTCKSLEGTWYSDGWADFNEDALGRVDIYLEFSGFVDWGVEKS